MQIPIQNIYYLLCYSWNKLDEKDRVSIDITGITELVDLFAKVLINATRILLKRGLEQNYTEVVEEFPGIKGKLSMSETLKRNLLPSHKTICEYDEFTPDVLLNQILITTLYKLMRTKKLDRGLKNEIRTLLRMLPNIEPIKLRPSMFVRMRLHRNNRFYGFIMHICELLYQQSLPSEEPGKYNFIDFTRDEVKMYHVFEKFVLNYYKIHHPGLRPRSESISWQLDVNDNSHRDFIPNMYTDITLQDEHHKIIIDTKYYQETLAERFEKKRVKSANLYQLFSYLLNQRDGTNKTMNATGILLYPKVDEDYDLEYKYDTHKIYIKTIDLDQHWVKIAERLDGIVDGIENYD
ncbi:MAG TPA: 5-methylcytosine-specific restriction endonuclease system specificity protein McrC [Saprospiraceae bacterium]|nr:5-methylcytosine-specific restriction endonuclease system specificity protein McrC [Saprospiraceae bacterium]